MAGFIPPSPPSWTSEQLATFYAENRNAIRAGQLLGIIFSALLLPWFAVISMQMARIEGRFPLLATIQMAAGTALTTLFLVVGIFWSAAAYREDGSAELVMLLHDLT